LSCLFARSAFWAKTSKHPPGLLAGHPFSSKWREKAASASGELANNFPANADLEATALHGPGEWFNAGAAVKACQDRLFSRFSDSGYPGVNDLSAIRLTIP
jgi:hypothetical protein